jgi:hypothetical protein
MQGFTLVCAQCDPNLIKVPSIGTFAETPANAVLGLQENRSAHRDLRPANLVRAQYLC